MYFIVLLLAQALSFEYLSEFVEVRSAWHPHLSFTQTNGKMQATDKYAFFEASFVEEDEEVKDCVCRFVQEDVHEAAGDDSVTEGQQAANFFQF
jgi:hypothetical protein